jgi:hypothetical protein
VIDLSTTAMPPQIADHVVAAALFGAPESAFADTLSPGALPTIGPLYATKTIDLCAPNDPICSDGSDMRAHVAYVQTGTVNQAATFAASRIWFKIEKLSAFHRTACNTADSLASSQPPKIVPTAEKRIHDQPPDHANLGFRSADRDHP